MEAQSYQWKILLIEDNPADIRLTQEALKALGINHRLEVARDGYSALVYLKLICSDQTGKLPDLNLLDLNLPGMNGLEVLAAIKTSEKLKSIPVIIMSSSASDVDVCAVCNLNANCSTRKPLEIDQFYIHITAGKQPAESNQYLGPCQ